MSDAPSPREFDVLVHGLIAVDYLLEVDGDVQPGAAQHIKRELRAVGGSAAVCALTLSEWGARVCLMGNPIGDGPNGRLVARDLAQAPDVWLHTPTLAGFETPYSVMLLAAGSLPSVLVRHDSVEAMTGHAQSVSSRLNMTQEPASLVPDWSVRGFTGLRAAICDTEFGDATHRLCDELIHAGVPLFLKGVPAGPPPGRPVAAVISTVARDCTDRFLTTTARDLAQSWQSPIILARRYGGGGVWCEPREKPHAFALPELGKPAPLGLAGVDDVWRAGLVWGHIHGWSWDRVLRFATTAAALKLTTSGTIGAIPSIDAIDSALVSRRRARG